MTSMQLSPISNTYFRTTKTGDLLIPIVSSETFSRLINQKKDLVVFQPEYLPSRVGICIHCPLLYESPWVVFKVRRSETICCLIGFGIGVGCCILYRIISNFLTPSSIISKRSTKAILTDLKRRDDTITRSDDYIRTDNISDEMTWSEMSSSLSTINLLHDSYHSNSLTGDSGVDCPEMPNRHHHQYSDDEHEIILRKTDTHPTSELSTEKGLERALEQTSRFYTDLEHIATDLESLSKRYSQHPSQRSIDALDWDLTDEFHSPKTRRQQQIIRSNNKNKIRRKLNTNINQTEYHESDNEHRLFDYSTSPLRRKHSSVYFDSTDEDNSGDETLQINS